MTNQTKALLAILVAAFFGGGIAVWTKVSLREIPQFSFVFLRFFLASLVIIPWFIKEKKAARKMVKPLLISLFPAANIFLFILGIQLTTAVTSQIIYSFVPILTAITAYFLIKEKFSKRKVSGILLGFGGLMITIFLPLNSGLNLGSVAGNLLILGGAASYSLYPVLAKKLQTEYSPLYLTTIFFLLTVVISSLAALSEVNQLSFWWREVSLPAWFGLLFTALLGTTTYYLLMQYAIKYGSAVISTLTLYLQFLTTVLWAKLILNEPVTWLILLGGVLVVSGAYLATNRT